jgi:chromate transporter
MIYLQIFWSFFKIGMFSFGGGYAMIPIIQREIESHGWIGAKEFADIVAVSQMTPGPLAVNAATYIGVKIAGIFGSAVATFAVSLPSFIIIISIANFLVKFKESNAINSVLKGIRPVTTGLISSAVIFFAQMSVFTGDISYRNLKNIFIRQFSRFTEGMQLHIGPLVIFLLILIAVKKFKLHPIPAVLFSAVLGIILT